MRRTRLSVCIRKTDYASETDALIAIARSSLTLRAYRCDRCRRFHLTSRTRGKPIPTSPGNTES